MKRNQKTLKLKKVQIAALKSISVKGGKDSEKTNFFNCFEESVLACSQSIGTGETTSMLTDNCHVDL